MNDFEDTIKYWPSEQIQILKLFCDKDNGIVDYTEILKKLGINEEKMRPEAGKSVGGILSALRRNRVENEPLIVPLGRVLGTRRLQWKRNPKVFTEETLNQYTTSLNQLLEERGIK